MLNLFWYVKKMENIKELRKICQPEYPEVRKDKYFRLYKRFLRNFSIYITRLVLYTNLNAYHMNLFVLLLGLTSAFLFAYDKLILGAIFIQLWYLFDCVDGEVARYRMRNLKRRDFKYTHGLYTDLNIHHIVHSAFFIGITINVYNYFNHLYIIIFGFLIIFSLLFNDLINLNRITSIFLEFKINPNSVRTFMDLNKKRKKSIERKSVYSTFFKLFYRFPGTLNVIFIAAIFNLFYYFLIFYGITFPLIVLIKFIKSLNLKLKDMLKF